MPKPFIPHDLPLNNLDWKSLAPRIAKANAELARYDGLLQTMVNPEILLSPLTTSEAVLSSMIEGTEASLGEVLQYEAGALFGREKTNDIHEIGNYRDALRAAETALLSGRAISLNLIKGLHQILMRGVRGQSKSPGEFRNTQNWIGVKHGRIEEATYIPPDPLFLTEYLEKWENYTHLNDEDILTQLAIIHAQFEIIHPFKDGNGRIGRILIPLFLFHRKALHRPMFYLSEFLERNRDEYYFLLTNISKANDWQNWILFFLRAVQEQSEINFEKAKTIFSLYNSMKKTILLITKSQFALPVLDTLFAKPIISVSEFMKQTGIKNRTTANTILRQLESEGILEIWKEGLGRSPAIFAFPKILSIAEGKDLFVANH